MHIYILKLKTLKDIPQYRYQLFSTHNTYSKNYDDAVNCISELSQDIPEQIQLQIEGIIIGPALVSLG